MSLLIKALKEAELRHQDAAAKVLEQASADPLWQGSEDERSAWDASPPHAAEDLTLALVTEAGAPETADDATEQPPAVTESAVQWAALTLHDEPQTEPLAAPPHVPAAPAHSEPRARPLATPRAETGPAPAEPVTVRNPASPPPAAVPVATLRTPRRRRTVVGLSLGMTASALISAGWFWSHQPQAPLNAWPSPEALTGDVTTPRQPAEGPVTAVAESPAMADDLSRASPSPPADTAISRRAEPSPPTVREDIQLTRTDSAAPPLRAPDDSPVLAPRIMAANAAARPSTPMAQPPARRAAMPLPAPAPSVIDQAYAALRAHDFAKARTGYQQVLNGDPRNLDALLGMAAVEAYQGNRAAAERAYLTVLEVEPHEAAALAGLASLRSDIDPSGQESHLRHLIASQPSEPALHFALGNTLAAQNRWGEAQQAYFAAYRGDDSNPDYAFNLAVSLEWLRSPSAAAQYYQHALERARQRPARFNTTVAQQRLERLTRGATLESAAPTPPGAAALE